MLSWQSGITGNFLLDQCDLSWWSFYNDILLVIHIHHLTHFVYPAVLWGSAGASLPRVKSGNTHTDTHTLGHFRVESNQSKHACFWMVGGMYPEKSHSDSGKTCKLRIERPSVWAGCKLLGGNDCWSNVDLVTSPTWLDSPLPPLWLRNLQAKKKEARNTKSNVDTTDRMWTGFNICDNWTVYDVHGISL